LGYGGHAKVKMTEEPKTQPNKTPNEWADYWRYNIGVNVLGADSSKKSRLQNGHSTNIALFLKINIMTGRNLTSLIRDYR
jgi:hypothetical protein